MPPGIGYSFNPSQPDLQMPGQAGSQRTGGLTPQQAVRILSLRVPERPSPTAIAPLPLIASQGGGGRMAGLDSLVAMLMRAFQGGGGGQGGGVPDMGSFGQSQASMALSGQTPSFVFEREGGGIQAPPPPPAPAQNSGEFDYGTFDQAGYQQYQQQNPDNPISPFEYQNRSPLF